MKKIICIFFLFYLSILPINLFAKPGPPIPKPSISIHKAIKIAKHYFNKKEKNLFDTDFWKKEEFIITSVKYTKYFMEKPQKEWAWIIEFRHPVINDHSFTYKIKDNKVELLAISE